MRIVACYKLVPEEQDIAVSADKTLDFSAAQWKISQYDLNAIEAGMKLAEATEGQVLALTAGDENTENTKLKKSVLSRGPAEMYAVKDDALGFSDCCTTAAVLKAAIEKIGGIDLVLCGEGSGDIYAQQVGPLLGMLLGWPTVNAVSSITAAEGSISVERSLESSVEVLEVSLPAVVCVTTDINRPRIPGMKDILGAGKKPSTVWSLADLGAEIGSATETVSVLAPEQTDRLQSILEGEGEDNIDTLYNQLRKAL